MNAKEMLRNFLLDKSGDKTTASGQKGAELWPWMVKPFGLSSLPKEPRQLQEDVTQWPALPRYELAVRERAGESRDEAVAAITQTWIEWCGVDGQRKATG